MIDDLLEEFIAETRETLEILSGQLVQWERAPEDKGLVDSVFRFVHTVKGSCGFLDLPRLLKLSHAAEDLLSSARDGRILPSPQLVSAVLAVIDKISDITNALETGSAVKDNDEELINAMLAFIPNAGQSIAIPIPAMETEILDSYSEPKFRSVRVSLGLLDNLMNGVSDMVLARNEVSRQMRKNGVNSELEQAFAKVSTCIADIRDAVGLMRMQPIERLFSSLPRLARDISLELGKELVLRIEGREVEIDREMVEALRDPLAHIVRNAADHGIESPSERLAAGKSAVGHIKIGARQSGNQILIEVSDDGRGIDVAALGRKVISSGLVTSDDWHKMSVSQRLEAIFLPGISTAPKITAISGRGVGMDVVKTNLRSIGGTIDLENIFGKGLKMTMRLPLTLSIIAGLSLRAGDQILGIARSAVVEILSMSNKNVEIEYVGGKKIAMVRGKRLPYGRIEDLLDIDQSEKFADESGSGRLLIIINPAVGANFALDVAAVIDNEELVIKPGAPIIMENGLYAGTTLPDNGRPMLLLDPSGIACALGVGDHSDVDINNDQSATDSAPESKESAICFTSMDGRKQALRLSAIDRLEEVATENIKFIGGKLRANIAGEMTDIIGLDDAPPLNKIQMLRLTDGETCKYLAVNNVLDIFFLPEEIKPSAFPDMYEGIIKLDGDYIELLNVYRFFEQGDLDGNAGSIKALCFVETAGVGHWERQILQPLLAASGYQVSFNETDRAAAQIIISRDGKDAHTDSRLLRLRDQSHSLKGNGPSIYRYDRIGLISAIEAKLSGAA
jgi:two-component system, chemotaxis family, sensor kinase CheA